MRITKHSIESELDPSQIWKVLEDVSHWNTWDEGIEYSRINGPFQTGAEGCFKIVKGPILKTILTYVDPPKMFVQEAKLFLAKVVMSHSIAKTFDKTIITFDVEIKGPLAFFFALLIGPTIKQKLPIEMNQLLQRARLMTSPEGA